MSNAPSATIEVGSGYLEISEKGFGFLRSAENHYQPKPSDIFVTPDTIKKNFLREGCLVDAMLQPPHRGSSPQLKEVVKDTTKIRIEVPQDFTKKVLDETRRIQKPKS